MSELPSTASVGVLCPEGGISFLMVLAKVVASATSLSLPESITAVSKLEASNWPTVGHTSPLDLEENGSSLVQPKDLRVGDEFCLTDETKCSYQKKG